MRQRDNYMFCCNCGLAIKKSKMFIKKYQNTAICLCKKCAAKLCTEIIDCGIVKGLEKLKGSEEE